MGVIATRVAEFVAGTAFTNLDPRAVRMVTDAITDAIGTGLAGSAEDLGRILLDQLLGVADGAGADLIGVPQRANPADAALYNGAVIHALDYDDTAHPSYSHPSSHLVPVLLALGRRPGVDAARLLTGYVVGFELEGRLGRCLNMGHYLRGWHTTGTFGSLAAAAAAAGVLRLNPPQVETALGIAASGASGLRANFGTMTKPLHAGLAAQSGLRAALLAEAGFTASAEAFDGRFGFLDVYADGDRDDTGWDDLGSRWEILTEYGLALKPYPSCGATHPAIEAALTLHRRVGADGIGSVRVGVNAFTDDILIYPEPVLPLEGKFSMQYCVAAALLTGDVTLRAFTPERLGDPRVRELLPRIRMEVDDRVRDSSEFAAVVEVETTGGRRIDALVPLAEGKPGRWMSPDRLRGKFIDCAGAVLGSSGAERAFAAVQSLADPRPDVASILDTLRPRPQEGAKR